MNKIIFLAKNNRGQNAMGRCLILFVAVFLTCFPSSFAQNTLPPKHIYAGGSFVNNAVLHIRFKDQMGFKEFDANSRYIADDDGALACTPIIIAPTSNPPRYYTTLRRLYESDCNTYIDGGEARRASVDAIFKFNPQTGALGVVHNTNSPIADFNRGGQGGAPFDRERQAHPYGGTYDQAQMEWELYGKFAGAGSTVPDPFEDSVSVPFQGCTFDYSGSDRLVTMAIQAFVHDPKTVHRWLETETHRAGEIFVLNNPQYHYSVFNQLFTKLHLTTQEPETTALEISPTSFLRVREGTQVGSYYQKVHDMLSGEVMSTEMMKEITKKEILTLKYDESQWSSGVGQALQVVSDNEQACTFAKTKYRVQINMELLDSSRKYVYHWIERFISADGNVTNDLPRQLSFTATGGVIETPVYEIPAPNKEGSVTPMMIDPDFLISDISFEEAQLVPDGKATTRASVAISDLKYPGRSAEYLNRIRWQVVALKDGKMLGVSVAEQDVANNLARALVKADEESGNVYIMAYDLANPGVYARRKIEISCGSCSGSERTCGNVGNKCVALTVGLGKAVDGSSAGSLTVLEKKPDAYIYSPVALQYPVDNVKYSEVLRDVYGSLRQVKTASVFADMVVPESLLLVTSNETTVATNCTGYEIRLYNPDAAGAFSDGVYQIEDGHDPYKIWRIEDPDLLANNYWQVKISEIMNGEISSKTNINLFIWDVAKQGWELRKGVNSAGEQAKQIVKRGSVIDGDMRIETRLVTDDSGKDALKTFSYYRNYFFGEALVKEIQDPDGAALVTDYTYYTDESDSARMGKIESVKHPDGSWVKYVYDDEGRKTSVWSPWLDVTLEQATASNCRRKDTSYEPVDSTDLSQTNGYVILHPRLITEYIEGTPVSRKAFAYYTNVTERIEKVVEYDNPVAGSYADAANRVSTSIYHLETNPDPDLADNLKRTESYDGLVATYGSVRGDFTRTSITEGTFSFNTDTNGTWLCQTVTNGIVSNPAGVANKTTISVSYRNPRGGVALSETYVYTGSSYDRINWATSEYDYDLPQYQATATGHVINRYYSDGTLEENQWSSCCGLERVINRQGQTEIYGYDALDRRDSVYKADLGITTTYRFDAAGRQVSMTESGGGLSRITGSSYDLAGQLLTSTNEAGLVISYTNENGGRISTTVMPGDVTQITESYIDGRTKHVYGTGTVEQTYEYGFESSDGSQWTKVYTGSQGVDSPRWQKTITAASGKTIRTEQPGFGGEVLTTKYTYNPKGQLEKTEQLEGTTVKTVTLSEYDPELGHQTRSGMDVDKNNQLDLASMDRISDSDSSYWNDGTDWWRTGYSITYPKDNSAQIVTNSLNKTRVTGLGTAGVNGILMSESISKDVFGNETVSQSWLDRATKTVIQITDIPTSTEDQISITVNGLLSSVSSVSSVVQTFGYDALGRRTTVADPRTGTATTHYNANGQVEWSEDTHGVRTGYTYYPETGQRFSTSTPNGTEVATTYVAYDLQGQLKRQWGSATYPVSYDYDEYGQKTHLHTYRGGKDWDGATWSGNTALADTTEWVYDPATGLLTQKLYADKKGPSYTYWPSGQLKTRTWERGITTTYSYWDTGELKTTEYTDDTETISYSYYRMGQQKQIDDAQGTRTFDYTTEGQLDTETLNGAVIDRSYDPFGRNTGYSTAGILPAPSVEYGFDTYGRFSAITSSVFSASTEPVESVVQYSYLPNSGLLSGHTARLAGGSPILTVTKGYEPDRNLIVGVTNTAFVSSAPFVASSFTYTNDDLGRRTRRTDNRTAGFQPAQSYWEYGYNSRSELTNAVRHLPDAAPVAGQSKSYLYDNIGNRRLENHQSEINDRQSIYTANSLNQYTQRTVPSYVDVMGTATNSATVTVRDAAHNDLPAPVIRQNDYFYKAYPVNNLTGAFNSNIEINAVINPAGTNDPDIVKTETRAAFMPKTPETYVYDDDGNLTTDGRFSYTWNGENRLITVDSIAGILPALHAEYAYDYQGRRFTKTVDSETTSFLWNGNHIIHEQSPTRTNTYTWGMADHLVAATLRGIPVFYAHDANKNSTDLVDASGAIVGQYDYDAYGNLLMVEGALAKTNPFRFSNEYVDAETGFSAYKYRYYNSVVGRWPNRDPIEEQGGKNLYGFVKNEPTAMVDKLGLVKVKVVSILKDGPSVKEMRKASEITFTVEIKFKPVVIKGGRFYRQTAVFSYRDCTLYVNTRIEISSLARPSSIFNSGTVFKYWNHTNHQIRNKHSRGMGFPEVLEMELDHERGHGKSFFDNVIAPLRKKDFPLLQRKGHVEAEYWALVGRNVDDSDKIADAATKQWFENSSEWVPSSTEDGLTQGGEEILPDVVYEKR